MKKGNLKIVRRVRQLSSKVLQLLSCFRPPFFHKYHVGGRQFCPTKQLSTGGDFLKRSIDSRLLDSETRKKTAFFIVVMIFSVRLFFNFDSSLFVGIVVSLNVCDHFISSYFES